MKLELNKKKQQQNIYKQLEVEQHIVPCSVGHRSNKRVNQKVPEYNEKENTTNHNLWGTAKAVLRGTFIAMSAYIKNTERSEVKDLILHLKILEKQEQVNPKTSRR
jgi:hypothetical protein